MARKKIVNVVEGSFLKVESNWDGRVDIVTWTDNRETRVRVPFWTLYSLVHGMRQALKSVSENVKHIEDAMKG
jgi:hypothetical protein